MYVLQQYKCKHIYELVQNVEYNFTKSISAKGLGIIY